MEKNLVVQSTALIEAHYKQEYSVQEQRTVLWVISEVHKKAHFSTRPYRNITLRISAQEYADLMDVSVKNIYRDAQKIGNQLMEKVIKIESAQGWEMFHWISSMKYIKNEAIIEVSLSENILPHIIDLERYASFKLENILYLNSSYAIKIYQLLAQYKKIGIRDIGINELRSILGIENLGAYKLYGNIKTRILDISKREINEKTDLTISYSEIKKRRKVEAIKFKITQKTKPESKFSE
jgi:plasmid replication initiation protein